MFKKNNRWLGAFPIPLDWDRPWQVWMRENVYVVNFFNICFLKQGKFHWPGIALADMYEGECMCSKLF